jgi:hypothetical protein
MCNLKELSLSSKVVKNASIEPASRRSVIMVKMPGPVVSHTSLVVLRSIFTVAVSSASRTSGCSGERKAKKPLMTIPLGLLISRPAEALSTSGCSALTQIMSASEQTPPSFSMAQ